MNETSPDDQLAIAAWIADRAIPLEVLEPSGGWADLNSLHGIVGDARVVGLGEAAHGVHEFITLKHRLVQWLVCESDFTAIALEASFSACRRINDYVLHGRGDLAEALTGQGYLAWDCQEFDALLRWLRRHNQTVSEDRRVAFYGLDTGFNEVGRELILNYLSDYAPERLDAAQVSFAALAELESRWPFLNDTDQPMLGQLYGQLSELDQYLTDHASPLSDQSSPGEVTDIQMLLRVMMQWAEPGADQSRHLMGRNLLSIMDRERAEAKVVVWAANAHIGRAFRFDPYPTLGDLLTDRWGTQYLAIGLEFGQGSYLTRTISTGMTAGDLKSTIMPPPPRGSLPSHLASTPLDSYVLDLRDSASDPAIRNWLAGPQLEHGGMWVYIDPSTAYHDATIASHYDGLIFVRNITPTQPTKNALRSAAAHTGL